MSKCVIKANDMSPQMSKFATKVGIEALQAAQTEQVRVTLALSTLFPRCFSFGRCSPATLPACLPLSFVLLFCVLRSTNKKPGCTDPFLFDFYCKRMAFLGSCRKQHPLLKNNSKVCPEVVSGTVWSVVTLVVSWTTKKNTSSTFTLDKSVSASLKQCNIVCF